MEATKVNKEVIYILIHDINRHEEVLAISVIENPVVSDHKLFDDHSGLRNRMETFLKRYNQLKPEFTRYLAKYMQSGFSFNSVNNRV